MRRRTLSLRAGTRLGKGSSLLEPDTHNTLEYIRHLSQAIGGRGSCTPGEFEAARFAALQMELMGVEDVRLEPYRGAPSTYRPYALAFAGPLLGTAFVWLSGAPWGLAVASALSFLGVCGMLAETDFSDSWMRWLLPQADSQNAVGIVRPTGPVRARVILCAHLDTHRTPIFYSSKVRHMIFSLLVGAAFASMVVSGLAYGLGAITAWHWVRWIGLAGAAVQLFALSLCIHADLTPFSPGANDDASGVGVILSLAEHLQLERLTRTEVWLAFTGCEEASARGMVAFLDTHAATLGPDAVYLILDQVGSGRLRFLTADGLLVKRKTHPRAIELARRANSSLQHLDVTGHVGIAYTDAAVATKRGLVALTVDALPEPTDDAMHWHQMSDTWDKIDPKSLSAAHTFTWQVLKEIDQP